MSKGVEVSRSCLENPLETADCGNLWELVGAHRFSRKAGDHAWDQSLDPLGVEFCVA